MSTEQVERLCDLMSGLQDLLDATQFDAECASLDLWEIVDLVLEDLDPVLRQSGAQISAVKPNERIYVCLLYTSLDGGRLAQVIQPSAALIVLGGTIGAVMVQYPPVSYTHLDRHSAYGK